MENNHISYGMCIVSLALLASHVQLASMLANAKPAEHLQLGWVQQPARMCASVCRAGLMSAAEHTLRISRLSSRAQALKEKVPHVGWAC